jgi:hypothetical protein
MNAHYSATTGRDCCCVGPNIIEKEKEEKCRCTLQYVTGETMGYLGLFLKDLRTDEAKFFNHFGMSVDS